MRKHLVAASAILAAVILPLGGCTGASTGTLSSSTVAPTPQFPLTLPESDGSSLTLTGLPQRIVSLSTAATEIFCALGAGDQLVAVELNANCPPGSDAKPKLDAYQPNPEAIVAYRPDLVFVFDDPSNIVETLRRLGTRVLYLKLPTTLAGVIDQIEILGRVSGHRGTALQVTQGIRDRVAIIHQKLASVSRGPRYYYELDPTYFTVSDHSFVGDLYNQLKGQNIASGASQDYPQLSAEIIIQHDPEVIVIGDGPAGVSAQTIRQRPGWQQISAVRTGRFCVVDVDIVNVPGTKIVDALGILARCLYPDLFR
jgi:iron complex transport system substrate-binding protein